jgi:hypothetical protein
MTKEITRRDAILRAVATAAAMGTMPRAIGSALAAENGDGADRRQAAPFEVDTLLEGGTIVDGSGAPSFLSDAFFGKDNFRFPEASFPSPRRSRQLLE